MTIQSLAFSLDANHDGTYSAWELWEVGKAIYHLPGNLVVEALGQFPFAQHYLQIEASAATGYSSLNGTLAIALSLAFWVAILFTVLTVASPTDPESLQQPAEIPPRKRTPRAPRWACRRCTITMYMQHRCMNMPPRRVVVWRPKRPPCHATACTFPSAERTMPRPVANLCANATGRTLIQTADTGRSPVAF